jgi:hypothetical protein
MFNRSLLLAGIFTIGAAFGSLIEPSEAAPIQLADVVITSSVPTDACVTFEMHANEMVYCQDAAIEGWYDEEHYAVEADTDGEGFYLLVWK